MDTELFTNYLTGQVFTGISKSSLRLSPRSGHRQGRLLGRMEGLDFQLRQKAELERQRLMLNKLLDGFEGKLTSSKWAKIAKDGAGGRSTSYSLKEFGM